MKIAINTFSIVPNEIGGGETYLLNVIRSLARIDKTNTYYLYVSDINSAVFNIDQENFIKIVVIKSNKNKVFQVLAEQVLIPIYNIVNNIDVLFCPSNVATLVPFSRVVLAIQSLHHIYVPEEFTRIKYLYWKYLIPISLKRARSIICVSKYLAKQVVLMFGGQNKISVVYEGVDFKKLGKANVESESILFVSTLYKFKNADKAIRAFKILRDKYGRREKLMIIGKDVNNNLHDLKMLAEELQLTDHIVFTGHIPHNEIYSYYEKAKVFVYPSICETFGLPPLEAMFFGVPVVA